jgi:uncharacterized membrane protein (UPF0136 family)
MSINPYAPPRSSVGDVARDDEILRRYSKIATIVAVNAALFGVLIVLFAFNGMVRRNAQGTLLAAHVLAVLYGALAIVAAMGLYRQQRWAAIVWLVESALILLVPLFQARFVRPAEFVIVGFLVAQFIGSIVGFWVVARRRDITAGA